MPLPGRPGRQASSVTAISIIPWVGAFLIILVDRNIQDHITYRVHLHLHLYLSIRKMSRRKNAGSIKRYSESLGTKFHKECLSLTPHDGRREGSGQVLSFRVQHLASVVSCDRDWGCGLIGAKNGRQGLCDIKDKRIHDKSLTIHS